MLLADKLSEYIHACFTGLWIQSHEHPDALAEISQLCRAEHWRLTTWDIAQGLAPMGPEPVTGAGAGDPLAAIRALGTFPESEQPSLLVLVNFHRFLQSGEIVQALARQINVGKQSRTFIVILSPIVQLPAELEKLFVVLEHDLPTRVQLEEIARGVATDPWELPVEQELERVLDAAAGLTRYEAENAFSLALVRHGQVEPSTIWQLKSQTLLKSGLMTLHKGGDTFAQLGGLESLKAFSLRALRPRASQGLQPQARGVLLLGVPGTGKSAFCQALGNETGRPTLVLDIGSLMGSLVGQSEERTRQALKIIDAMAPCIAYVDEVEKAFSGIGGQNDSGVASRMFGTFLAWLNDHTSDVFVVCTANDVSRLPPEFSRSERFDGVFFLDLPGAEQRDRIWQLYLEKYCLDARQKRPTDDAWTGAEIKSCCRLAALLDVPLIAAAQNVVPVAITAAESVDRLRTWASGRCLSADRTGIYQHTVGKTGARRKVTRGEASSN